MKSTAIRNLVMTALLASSSIQNSCGLLGPEKGKDEESTAVKAAKAEAPAGAIIADSGAFALQEPIKLTADGIDTSIENRVYSKLDELDKALDVLFDEEGNAKLPGSVQVELLLQQDGTQSESTEESTANIRQGIADAIKSFKDILNEHILIKENLIEETGDSLVYDIDGKSVCEDDQDPESCIDIIDNKLKLAVKFYSPNSDTIAMEPVLGSKKLAPFTILASSIFLGVRINFSDLKESVEMMNELSDSQEDPIEVPEELSGDLGFYLYLSDKDTYSIGIKSSEGVKLGVLAEGKTVNWSLKPSPKLGLFSINTVTEEVTVGVDLMGMDLKLPLDTVISDDDPDNPITEEQKAKMKTLAVHLERIAGALTIKTKEKQVILEDINLGDAPHTISHDGKSFAELNFSGAKDLDLMISDLENATEFKFSKSFSLAAKLNFNVLEGIVNDIPSDFSSETMHIALEGGTPTLRQATNFLKVAAGKLTFKSVKHGKSQSIEEGKCLSSVEGEVTAWIDGIQSTTCP